MFHLWSLNIMTPVLSAHNVLLLSFISLLNAAGLSGTSSYTPVAISFSDSQSNNQMSQELIDCVHSKCLLCVFIGYSLPAGRIIILQQLSVKQCSHENNQPSVSGEFSGTQRDGSGECFLSSVYQPEL